ncbi:MAG: magnesium transporter CorA family protein [Bacillota bacterium]|nr:magnesium transporter CorA family protein [Bacillota bacterium]
MIQTIQLPNAPCHWVHLDAEDADPGELDRLASDWQIPPDWLGAVLDPDAIARAKTTGDGPQFIALLYPLPLSPDGLSYATRLLGICWCSDRVLTATARTAPFLDELMADCSEGRRTPSSITALILEIAEATARHFIEVTRLIDTERSRLVDRLTHSTRTEHLIRLSQLQTSLVYFDQAVAENHPIYHHLGQLDVVASSEHHNNRLAAVLQSSQQAEKMVHQSATMLANLNATYSGIVSNRLNVIMKRLTALTIILTVPTIVGAFWGMNVTLPFAGHPLAFWALVGLSVLLCLLIVLLLGRRDLL